MTITIVAIGKQHASHIQPAVAQYQARLKRFSAVSWDILPPAGSTDAVRSKTVESQVIQARLQPTDTVILLDERGEQWSSAQLATKLEDWQVRLSGRLVFVIGGAYGVDDALRSQAAAVWSLSKLTFAHQLVRVLLLEQLYRGFAILHHLPYHH